MRRTVELADIHHVVLIFEHSSFVVVNIEVVGGAEDGHNAREARCPCLPIHSITGVLGFVGADDGEEIVLLQEGAC